MIDLYLFNKILENKRNDEKVKVKIKVVLKIIYCF